MLFILLKIPYYISEQSTDIKPASAIAKTMVFCNGFHDIFNESFTAKPAKKKRKVR